MGSMKKMQYAPRNRDSFLDQLNPFANRMFQHAVMQGDMAVVSLMLKHGTVVRRNERNRHGLTALQQSVLDSNSRLAMRLLESGADLEAKTSNGWTSLHIAAATGDINMVNLLLTHCADVVALTVNDELPIDLAMNKDMKVILANEMSRCGYIELSQWYMAKMTPQDNGVFYVMSADSLLEIACVSPEQYPDTYGLYPPNTMHSYSSMVSLPRSSTSDVSKASKNTIRKGSVCSLSQHNMNNPLTMTHDAAYLHPVSRGNKADTDTNNQQAPTGTSKCEHIPKSFSSGYLSESAEPCNVQERDRDASASKERMPACLETEFVSEDAFYCDQNSTVVVSNVTETGTMRRIKRKYSMKRKTSDSVLQYNSDWAEESVQPVYVNIDYNYRACMEQGDDSEEDADYIEFKANGRPRVGSSTSGSSLGCRGSMHVSSSGSLIEYTDAADSKVFSGDKTLLSEFAESAENHEEVVEQLDGSFVYASNTELEISADFAGNGTATPVNYHIDPAAVPVQYRANNTSELRIVAGEVPVQFGTDRGFAPVQFTDDPSKQNLGPSLFEIDTDSIDYRAESNSDSIEDQHIQTDAQMKPKRMSGLEDDDVDFQDSNMYFNPMYRSADNSLSVSPEKQTRKQSQDTDEASQEEHESTREASEFMRESREFTQESREFTRESREYTRESRDFMREPRGFTRESFNSRVNGKWQNNKNRSQPSQRSFKDRPPRELFRNEEEYKEGKRKKRGLLSELVSKFKGTVKLHRTSSDTDLQSPDEGAVMKRDVRKTKSLRRRRHVRRSNSFSSYFPPDSDKQSRDRSETENSRTKGSCQGDKPLYESTTNGKENGIDLQINARPYSTHRKDPSPLQRRKMEDNTQQAKLSSRNDTDIGNHVTNSGKMARKAFLENGACEGFCMKGGRAEFVENGGSKIPRRSFNTYSKAIPLVDEHPGQHDNGCMSMKFLCK